MRLEPTPRPDHILRVSTKLITLSHILHLSSEELERAVNQELMENPALDVVEQQVCLFCGTPLHRQTCSVCGNFAQIAQPLTQTKESLPHEYTTEPQWNNQQSIFYDIDNSGFIEADSDDEYDPMARLPTSETLVEALLRQLETLISPEDASIAEQLVGNLDERGYLEVSIQEIANHLKVPTERVAHVLSQLQTLEPLGIGARNPRECLLIQLQALSDQNPPHPLAYTLIESYLGPLGRNQFHEIARKLKVPEQEIRQASQYIRTTLHPYPAHLYQADTRDVHLGHGTTYIRPDVIIREGETGFEVELIEEKRYHFSFYTNYIQQGGDVPLGIAGNEVQRYMHSHSDHAKFFVESIYRRWRTLKRVADFIVDYQHEFLEKGVRYLHPLTRTEVATRLNLDEGTVSRATANKYALLPKGRLIPFSDFFDGSLRIKDILRELLHSEDSKHRLSDDELARILTAQGIPIARRTVTKYREEMGINSSRGR